MEMGSDLEGDEPGEASKCICAWVRERGGYMFTCACGRSRGKYGRRKTRRRCAWSTSGQAGRSTEAFSPGRMTAWQSGTGSDGGIKFAGAGNGDAAADATLNPDVKSADAGCRRDDGSNITSRRVRRRVRSASQKQCVSVDGVSRRGISPGLDVGCVVTAALYLPSQIQTLRHALATHETPARCRALICFWRHLR